MTTQNPHTTTADIWSSGILLFAFCSGYLPFDDGTDEMKSHPGFSQMEYQSLLTESKLEADCGGSGGDVVIQNDSYAICHELHNSLLLGEFIKLTALWHLLPYDSNRENEGFEARVVQQCTIRSTTPPPLPVHMAGRAGCSRGVITINLRHQNRGGLEGCKIKGRSVLLEGGLTLQWIR
jgi:serine/threonine protein kinase